MNFAEFIAAILIALFFTLLIRLAFKVRGPWGSFWSFALILLLGVWAASLWINPVGPVYFGVAWIPLFFVGLTLALVLAAATPTAQEQEAIAVEQGQSHPANDAESVSRQRKQDTGMAAISGFFWIMIIVFAVAIVSGYAI